MISRNPRSPRRLDAIHILSMLNGSHLVRSTNKTLEKRNGADKYVGRIIGAENEIGVMVDKIGWVTYQ